MYKLIKTGIVAAAAMLVGVSLSAPPARAAYIVTLQQVGADVVATGSGTINLAGLTSVGSDSYYVYEFPAEAQIITGPATGPAGALDPYTVYYTASGPSSFGNGSLTFASSGTGDTVGILGNTGAVFVPTGYTSGNHLADTSTYDNQTFNSLGLAPGTYVYNFGSGANADTFTVQIGTVPEPGSLALLSIGLLGLGLALGRRRRAG